MGKRVNRLGNSPFFAIGSTQIDSVSPLWVVCYNALACSKKTQQMYRKTGLTRNILVPFERHVLDRIHRLQAWLVQTLHLVAGFCANYAMSQMSKKANYVASCGQFLSKYAANCQDNAAIITTNYNQSIETRACHKHNLWPKQWRKNKE